MTAKLVLLVAALLLLAGMIGRSLGARRGVEKKRTPPIEAARKCLTCGAYTLESAGCEREDCPRR